MEYFVYIMASRSRTLYTRVTSNLARRVYEHRNHLISGFTDRYCVERLVYFESTPDVRAAIEREKQIKRWRRDKKIMLIEMANPDWRDLAEAWREDPAPPPEHATRPTNGEIPRLGPEGPRSE
jgi:putative endonuclease